MGEPKDKEYKGPYLRKRQPVYAVFKCLIMRLIFRKPEIINLAGELPQGIVVANHSAKSGPACLDLFYPVKTVKWGAYQMFGNFESRKRYLRDVLNIQKCHKKPGFMNSLKSSLMAIFNPWVYKGMRMLPTYPDGRLMKTLRYSETALSAGYSVMVFPENSNDGYHEVLKEVFPGFVMLAEKHFRATGVDLPVFPVYYHIKKRKMIIGKPIYVQELVKQGLNRTQIAQVYCDAINQLYYDYVQDKPETETK